ncbi:hypothetical protein [Rhodanobacter sp. A1T4]|uniref:hypothetical protein n=1 Tax=Rhodanobacter sp. A1T4 TaxID=2723087 RepID=UPI001616785E|nr:hypothetical protein [Rhodanobacter sp. A1T4]MBB6246226.1 putative membrane protein YccC [Rhodanobacter sp. A1T4]
MPHKTESYAAIICVSLGLVVSTLLAPKNSFFLANAAFYWASQLGVLAFVFLFEPRPAIVAGVAIALATYLAAFGIWVFTRMHPDSMAWLLYVFSLPGATVGAVGVAGALRSRSTLHPLIAGSVTACVVLAGVILNQAAVCSTFFYCLGK